MRKRRSKAAATWEVPIYTGRVFLYTDYDDFADTLEALGEERPEKVSGMTAMFRVSGERQYIFGVFDSSLQTAVHEMAHVAMMLLEDVGVMANDSNGETFCYLLDSLWARFEKPLLAHTHGF